MLINTVALGGNLLMNVGPTSRGTFDYRALDALSVYRDWIALHSESIYGCTMSEYEAPQDCRLTQNDNSVYVHIYAWPFKHLLLKGLRSKVRYASFLHDGSEIPLRLEDWTTKNVQADEDTLVLELPIVKPDVVVPVIKLELKA